MSNFAKNVTCKTTEIGYQISCRLGLWSVEAKSQDAAFREARHYFAQYELDGEYDGTVAEKLKLNIK